MRVATLLPVVALCLLAARACADEQDGALWDFSSEQEARTAMNTWTTYKLAPELMARCSHDFPDKAAIYDKAIARWLDRNSTIAWRGEPVYRAVTELRTPGRDADEVLAAGVARALAAYDAKPIEARLEHCDSAFLNLKIDVGPVAGPDPMPAPITPAAPASPAGP